MGAVVRLNRKAARDILRSAEVLKDLKRRGDAIAERAAKEPGDIEVEPYVGRNRARVTVRTATPRGAAREAKYRTLTSSLDAGRS